jgi:hypothetical protein
VWLSGMKVPVQNIKRPKPQCGLGNQTGSGIA